MNDICFSLDSTLLKTNITKDDITTLVLDCLQYNFRGVCIPPCFIERVRVISKDILVSTVIGFPFGFEINKIDESKKAIDEGVNELDVVWNQIWFRNNYYLKVVKELTKIVDLGVTVKVIVEDSNIAPNQIEDAWQIVKDSGAYAIKTGTGVFGAANLDTVKYWHQLNNIKNYKLRIKAAGGIKTLEQVNKFIAAGADIIGTSNAVNIAKELQ